MACSFPDFIGFLYEEGFITAESRRYVMGGSKIGLPIISMDELERGYEVLTPTHVLFKKKVK